MSHFTLEQEKGIKYAHGHLVSSIAYPEDAHAGDSRDLADDAFLELGITARERELLEIVAEEDADRLRNG